MVRASGRAARVVSQEKPHRNASHLDDISMAEWLFSLRQSAVDESQVSGSPSGHDIALAGG